MTDIKKSVYFITITLFVMNLIVICLNASSLETGNKISDFELHGENGIVKRDQVFKKGRYSLIIVFAEGCFYCNKNFPILNKVSFMEKLNVYGIVQDKSKVDLYRKLNKTKFKLYFSSIKNFFEKKVKIRKDVDYIVLCKGDEIIFTRTGVLSMDDYILIKTIVSKDSKRER